MGPEPVSTVLSAEQEAIAVAFRRHTLLALDDCLYALQVTIPHLWSWLKDWSKSRIYQMSRPDYVPESHL